MEQTSPALDLTTLFNGFKPLFQALKPDDVNELTLNLVQVLQGEGGTVQGLLQKTASLTTRWPTATSSSATWSTTSPPRSRPSTAARSS